MSPLNSFNALVAVLVFVGCGPSKDDARAILQRELSGANSTVWCEVPGLVRLEESMQLVPLTANATVVVLDRESRMECVDELAAQSLISDAKACKLGHECDSLFRGYGSPRTVQQLSMLTTIDAEGGLLFPCGSRSVTSVGSVSSRAVTFTEAISTGNVAKLLTACKVIPPKAGETTLPLTKVDGELRVVIDKLWRKQHGLLELKKEEAADAG